MLIKIEYNTKIGGSPRIFLQPKVTPMSIFDIFKLDIFKQLTDPVFSNFYKFQNLEIGV
jgi:hypothetical protein